jgi:hypothetical protein
MTTLVFDRLKLARKLEAAGFPPKQAADTAEALAESLGEIKGLATKEDIAGLRGEMQALELRLVRWLLGVAAGSAVVVIGAVGTMLRLLLP